MEQRPRARRCGSLAAALLALGAFAFAFPRPLAAEASDLKTGGSEVVNAVLLLDASGSMLLTDPLKLREEGAKLFSQFLRPGDRLAIVRFDAAARVVRPLTEFKREDIAAIGADISKVGAEGLFTDLSAGIRAAAEMLAGVPEEGGGKVIVLLSDGKMDPDPARGAARALTDQLILQTLPQLREAGIRVHTLAFSDQADQALLSEIAAATEGVSWFTPTADKIHESFADLFLVVKKPQVVPITAGKGFKIDSNVSEATFYVNREQGREVAIVSPSGERFVPEGADGSKVRWFRGQKFDVVTIVEPESGEWHVAGVTSSDGFATLLTNLKLVSDFPSAISAGETALFQARLFEDNKPVVLPEMSEAIRFALQVSPTDKVAEPFIREFLRDDGSHGDRIARDGIFSYRIRVEEPGEYKLWAIAKAPTFERSQQIPFRVKPPLIALSVVSVDSAAGQHGAEDGGEHGDHGGEAAHTTRDYFRVELSPEAASLRNVEVKLMAYDEKRKRYQIPLQRAGAELRYEVPAALLPQEGEYELQAFLEAEAKRGGHVREQTRTLTYTRVPEQAPTEAEQSETIALIVEEPEEEEASPLSPVPFAGIAVLLNLLLGAAGFVMLKKLRNAVSFTMPELSPLEPALAAVSALEGRIARTEIALDDPVFGETGARAPAAVAEAEPAQETEGEAPAPDAGSEAAPQEEGAPEEGAAEGEAAAGVAASGAESAPEEAPAEEAPAEEASADEAEPEEEKS